jgi:hypothetical protein
MMQVPFAITLTVDLKLLPLDQGGVATPVSSGYRPICTFKPRDADPITVGMCQLELVDVGQLAPGGSARGMLRFAPGVAEIVRDVAEIGSDLDLGEGRAVVGSARVLAID